MGEYTSGLYVDGERIDFAIPTRKKIRLTPRIATILLEANGSNRPVVQARVNSYARQMAADQWRYNPADTAIAVDWNGDLLNGQHRLWAVIDSGAAIYVDLVTGVDPSLFAVMDTGKARSGADVLSISGQSNAVQLTAMLAWQWRYDTAHDKENNGIRMNYAANPTNAQLVEILKAHPKMGQYALSFSGMRPKSLLSPSVAGWVRYHLLSIDAVSGAEFWEMLALGANLPEDHPVAVLRNALMAKMSTPRSKQHYAHTIGLVFKAWNLWVLGRKVQRIYLSKGEPIPLPLRPAQLR